MQFDDQRSYIVGVRPSRNILVPNETHPCRTVICESSGDITQCQSKLKFMNLQATWDADIMSAPIGIPYGL